MIMWADARWDELYHRELRSTNHEMGKIAEKNTAFRLTKYKIAHDCSGQKDKRCAKTLINIDHADIICYNLPT